MKTTMGKPSTIKNDWFHVDAEGLVLGRLATKIARVLMGKHKPSYTPHLDDGDFVVVTNCEKVRLTGKKGQTKVYPYYTGYLSGLRERKYQDVLANDPEDVIRLAVKRMLPKNRLGRKMIKKLKIYKGAEHPHKAQDPRELDLDRI